ncbi:MAG: OmpA family protein [Phycisphaerae bacterium]|nr:OmpA family protein [Phycisphaerae bacterium]
MNRATILSIVVLLGVVPVVTGCNDQCKEELTTLKVQYNDLQMEKGDLQTSFKDSQAKNNNLMDLLAKKGDELDAANAEIAKLKSAPKPTPTAKATVPAGWQETATGAKVTLASDILFSAGRATLSKQGAARLRQVAATIKATYPDSVVRVYGFTDSDPIKKTKKLWADNLDLSSNRAMAVVRQLRRLGISAGKLEAIGMGTTHPVAPNKTNAGKARNRRVEIVVAR